MLYVLGICDGFPDASGIYFSTGLDGRSVGLCAAISGMKCACANILAVSGLGTSPWAYI